MRTPSILTLAALSLLSAGAVQETTASSTQVIGYYRFNVPSGTSLWSNGFVTKKDFQGQATSHTGGVTSVINQTGATFGTLDLHYVEILDGTQAGLILDIVGNTPTSLTVQGNTGAAGYNLAQNVKYCVRRHSTLGTIFKNGANGGNVAQGLVPFETAIKLNHDNGTFETFYFDDTVPGIVSEDGSVNKDDEIVYPGQAIILQSGAAVVLTFGGNDVSYVKETPTIIPLKGNSVNLVGLINPIVGSAPLGGALTPIEKTAVNSVDDLLGVISPALVDFEDEVFIFGNNAGVFQNSGPYYYDSGTGDIVDGNSIAITTQIPNGTAFNVKLNSAANRSYKVPGVVVQN